MSNSPSLRLKRGLKSLTFLFTVQICLNSSLNVQSFSNYVINDRFGVSCGRHLTKPIYLRNDGRIGTTHCSIFHRGGNGLHASTDTMEGEDSSQIIVTSKLDQYLSFLTNLFPGFVLGAAILGANVPNSLLWVAKGNLVTIFLASVMVGTGMTLSADDFKSLFQSKRSASVIPVGVLCQYGIMPLSAFLISKLMILNNSAIGKSTADAIFLGLILVGCSPGGTASNLVTLIAGADVALSVLLTACSTILAAIMTPLLVKLLVSGTEVNISGITLCIATSKVVLGPVILGMFMNEKAPKISQALARFTPFASVILVALICGGVVAQNATTGMLSNGFDFLTKRIIWSVIALHLLGFLVGFVTPRVFCKFNTKVSRTISVETGMQNSALAVVLARSIGADPMTSLPGAISATAHSCIGSLLAAIWRFKDSRESDAK